MLIEISRGLARSQDPSSRACEQWVRLAGNPVAGAVPPCFSSQGRLRAGHSPEPGPQANEILLQALPGL